MTRLVGEHSSPHRRCVVRHAGASGKANVGISNDNEGEKPSRRKTEVSSIYGNQIRVSRVLRSSREAAYRDWEQVNIPVHVLSVMG